VARRPIGYKPRILRKRDALGRTYYVEVASGHRASKRRWVRDIDRRKEAPEKKRPSRKTTEKPRGPRKGGAPSPPPPPEFPLGVGPDGVPEFDPDDESTWPEPFGIEGEDETG